MWKPCGLGMTKETNSIKWSVCGKFRWTHTECSSECHFWPHCVGGSPYSVICSRTFVCNLFHICVQKNNIQAPHHDDKAPHVWNFKINFRQHANFTLTIFKPQGKSFTIQYIEIREKTNSAVTLVINYLSVDIILFSYKQKFNWDKTRKQWLNIPCKVNNLLMRKHQLHSEFHDPVLLWHLSLLF